MNSELFGRDNSSVGTLCVVRWRGIPWWAWWCWKVMAKHRDLHRKVCFQTEFEGVQTSWTRRNNFGCVALNICGGVLDEHHLDFWSFKQVGLYRFALLNPNDSITFSFNSINCNEPRNSKSIHFLKFPSYLYNLPKTTQNYSHSQISGHFPLQITLLVALGRGPLDVLVINKLVSNSNTLCCCTGNALRQDYAGTLEKVKLSTVAGSAPAPGIV